MHKKSYLTSVVLISFLCSVASAKDISTSINPNGWYGKNAQALSQIITKCGKKSSNYNPEKPPIAVFDWDNTVIKNDVGDALFYWMLANNKILQPPNKDWRRISPLLADNALKTLSRACSRQARAGEPLVTNQDGQTSRTCADEILNIYDRGKTTDSSEAWKQTAESIMMEPAYAWAVSLQAGYSVVEIKHFAQEAIEFNFKNEIGAVQTIGSRKDVTAYMRIYEQIKDLISTMQDSGFEVWVLSASSQPAVEVFAKRVGIKSDHVIGIRAVLDKNAKTTPTFQGCFAFSDGTYYLIPYKIGKLCWLNKVVYGKLDPHEQMNSSPIVFAAGDSDGDVDFLKDAKYRLVINRNKSELMCNAYYGINNPNSESGAWLVNPMFINPKPQRSEPYDCSKYNLPNQADSVY